MTTTAKGQKDKPCKLSTTPRLLPRQTAASAARAARNATNRNLNVPYKQSPTRASTYSPKLQGKNIVHSTPKTDSKTDVKIKSTPECEPPANNAPPMESKTFVIDNNQPPAVIKTIEQTTYEQTVYDTNGLDVPDKNFEACPNLVICYEFQELRNSEGDHQKPNESDFLLKYQKSEPKSRPQTPALCNRPQTPKSLQASRPQTPHILSRPTTPAHPVRYSTYSSRPNTPPRLPTPSRPKTPSIPVPPSSKVLSPAPLTNAPRLFKEEEEDLKSAFIAKQKQFQNLKRDLDLKQQSVLEVFDNLRSLREQMSREGVAGCGEGIQLQELVVFNVADWTSEEISQLCRDAAAASSATDGAIELISNTLPIDECALADLDSKVLSVPKHFADLCLQAFTARQELIDWVKELIEEQNNGSGECLERIARYNAHGLELCEALRVLKSKAEDAVDTISQLSKRALRERSALVAVGETLVREIARLRADSETHSAAIKELQESRIEPDHYKAYEDLCRDLDEERANHKASKEKLSNTEVQLRQARVRITKMDRQLREAEASITSLTSTVKALEDQNRQREVQLEARARKLKESLKTGEVASNQLAQQRDALQAEIQELKQQIESMIAQHKEAIHDLNCQLKETSNNLDEQRQMTELVSKEKEAVQAALAEAQINIEELKAKVTELENSKPNPDLPSEREMDLLAELQSTKDTLRMTEDEITACKREKVRFLETLTKITESDNKIGIQQKLAAELLSKEEILGKMQIQIRELTKNIKLNEQKVSQYEQYVRDLQAHNRAMANSQEAPDGISYEDLQQEIMDLRMSLLEAVHRKEELYEQVVQKEQQLEQQDKTSRAQARIIKVREELINMLKNKETEQSRELAALQQDLEHRMKVVDEVNKQIAAKADEIQELFSTLENKQQQIHRLEKIVLALEEQQRRAQAQRTRHEEKIAALEHELAAGANRRERKFLFF